MKYREYAEQKRTKYQAMGWKVGALIESESAVKFNSVDPDGVKRKHFFSDTAILVETGEFPDAKLEAVKPVVVDEVPEVVVEEKPEVVEQPKVEDAKPEVKKNKNKKVKG